jgi:hypothetical protein
VVLPAITVTAPRDLEAEPTDAASERRASGETLNTRPIQWPGETDKMGKAWAAPINATVRKALDAILVQRPGIGPA